MEGARLKLEAEKSTAQWGLAAAARAWPGPDQHLRMLGYRMGTVAGWRGEGLWWAVGREAENRGTRARERMGHWPPGLD